MGVSPLKVRVLARLGRRLMIRWRGGGNRIVLEQRTEATKDRSLSTESNGSEQGSRLEASVVFSISSRRIM